MQNKSELNRERIVRAKLYAITSPPQNGQSYERMVEAACKGGADIVQLREKTLSDQELISLGKKLGEICRRLGKVFVVNDRLDAALACGADGVHLGQDDLPVSQAREIAKDFSDSPFVIGCSTHSLEQALKAQSAGADYIGCGPVFPTPTKPGVPAVGLDLVSRYRENVRIPFVSIGGIDEQNVGDVVRAGASCVAVVRAVFGKPDIEESARSFKARMEFNAYEKMGAR